jgi:hypothetical protein
MWVTLYPDRLHLKGRRRREVADRDVVIKVVVMSSTSSTSTSFTTQLHVIMVLKSGKCRLTF